MNLRKRTVSRSRRRFLLQSGALLAAGATPNLSAQPSTNQVSLADFGGRPGASRAAIINAFHAAFEHLKRHGGGTLSIAPGRYQLGTYTEGLIVIGVKDLENVEVYGYGATLELTTAGTELPLVPAFFRLVNPSNVAFMGLSFYGHDTDLSEHYRGPVCFDIICTRPCSRIRTVDCVADNVVTYVRAFSEASTRYFLTDCDFQGTVRNAYYGVSVKYNGRFSKCRLNCFAVRRGFIGYDPKDWDITIHCSSHDNARGSNGFICIIPFTDGSAEDCNVNLTASGNIDPYTALIHFYHQGAGQIEYMRNIRASATLDNVTGRPTLFLFDHVLETGPLAVTLRTYRNVTLTGTINGSYAGKIVENPSVSIGDGNGIKISSRLAKAADLSLVPPYITSFTPV